MLAPGDIAERGVVDALTDGSASLDTNSLASRFVDTGCGVAEATNSRGRSGVAMGHDISIWK